MVETWVKSKFDCFLHVCSVSTITIMERHGSHVTFCCFACLYKEWPFFLASYRLPKTINHGLNSSRVPRRLLNHSLLRSLLPFLQKFLGRCSGGSSLVAAVLHMASRGPLRLGTEGVEHNLAGISWNIGFWTLYATSTLDLPPLVTLYLCSRKCAGRDFGIENFIRDNTKPERELPCLVSNNGMQKILLYWVGRGFPTRVRFDQGGSAGGDRIDGRINTTLE